MAYRITVTDLDTNEIKCEQETDAFVVVVDAGDNIAVKRLNSADLNTAVNMAEVLCMEAEHILSKLPKSPRKAVRKAVRKLIRKHIKQASKKR